MQRFSLGTAYVSDMLTALVISQGGSITSLEDQSGNSHDVTLNGSYGSGNFLADGAPVEMVAARYRYGFNGKENDNEVKGEGNQQDYGMRIYDPRSGRFLSVDPITAEYPELTPYQFASNRPIDGIDQDGLEFVEFARAISSATPVLKNEIEKQQIRDWLKEKFHYTSGVRQLYPNPNPESFSPGPVDPEASVKANLRDNSNKVIDRALSVFSTSQKELRAEAGERWILNRIASETRERIEGSPNANFLFIGRFIKGGRYELVGFHQMQVRLLKKGL